MSTPTYSWGLYNKYIENWAYWKEVFSKKECETIIDLFSSNMSNGRIGEQEGNLDLSYRDSKIHFIECSEDVRWIFERITQVILEMNDSFFRYDIHDIECLQFSEYDSAYKGFYSKHIDMLNNSNGVSRKLSFSIMISDPKDFDGGDLALHIGGHDVTGVKEQGALTMFPSFTLHEVKPVTKGTRYALVGWVRGPNFK